MGGHRGAETLFEGCQAFFTEVARQFLTAFCSKFLVNLLKDFAEVGVRLNLEGFMTSNLDNGVRTKSKSPGAA